jgi:hypothetical protein
MPLQSSGALAMSDINVELGNASNAQINMGGTAVRGLSGIASGAIRLGADFYGKANALTGVLLHTLNNPNNFGTPASDLFGENIAIDGNYVIIGARLEDDAGGTSSGIAYIFNVTTGNLVHTLTNPNAFSTSKNDEFSASGVAISGNYAIVSSSLEDGNGLEQGVAYIFNVTTGNLVHTLINPNAFNVAAFDRFGNSVAISGNNAIVAAQREHDAGGVSSGKAYIYNVTTGALIHTLNNPNAYGTSTDDFFGNSVAISGNYAIVGAYFEDYSGGTSSGRAYIFNVTTGALVHTLDNPNAFGTPNVDQFGFKVGISGNNAIISAYLEDDAGGTTSGKAYIFNVTTGALIHTLNNPNAYGTSASDQFGFTVGISSKYAIVGARLEDDAGGTDSGKAYLYDVSTGSLLHTFDNPNPFGTSAADQFSVGLAVSDSNAIIGSRLEDETGYSSSGKVYIFR